MTPVNQQLRFLSLASSSLEPGEIGVDLFAGGGGWSEGFQRATGVPPAVAVNHDEDAIEMHTANHPESEHHHEDVFSIDPVAACRGRKVGWLHLSPDCTHFSRAKGGKPRSQKIRGLAWVAVAWAKAVSPRIISLENVAEFQTWGPLDDNGQPIKERSGEIFADFTGQLRELGYAIEWKILNAADYGAPTSRRRLFLIARRDGRPIAWPKITHGPKGERPYRTAAECIDWAIPVPSIFDRKKPLAEATQRRIAEGIRRYVLNNPKPFLVNLTHGARVESIDEPFKTLTAAHRGEKAVVASLITKANSHGWDKGAGPVMPADRPLGTIVSKDPQAVIAPTLIQMGYGEREGQKPRALDLQKPLGTIVGGGRKHGLVAAFLSKHYGGVVGQPITQVMGTVTAKDHHALSAVHLTKFYGTCKAGAPSDGSAGTITAGGGHMGLVAAFLMKYYSSGGQWQKVDEPLHTIVDKARFGLVTISINGEEYVLADIGMRMLQPRELARAQGFPDSYILTGTKTAQVARIGNSVCPDVAAAIVKANLSDEFEEAAE